MYVTQFILSNLIYLFFPYWESVVLLNIIDNHLIPQALQGQISSQQVAVEKLKKTAEVLLGAKGSLLPAKNDIQKTLGKVSSFLFLVSAGYIQNGGVL